MIYVIFRIAKNYNCKLTPLIAYNYLAATLLGLLVFQPFSTSPATNLTKWIPFAIVLGILFIAIFYLIGSSSQKAGITVTTLANKLSLVFPVLFSLIYFNEQISTLKYIGVATAVIAVVLTVYKKDLHKTNLSFILLPAGIFFGSGLIDSIVKFVQAVKIKENEVTAYTTSVFFVAFLCALIISFLRRKRKDIMHYPTLVLGIILGAANFGSLYFLINALNKSNLNSSLVFTLNNMAIVALTALLGTALFREKLNKINFAGILLAILSLYFLI
jgi:drug/metabolite transporter (DMT)-like permease